MAACRASSLCGLLVGLVLALCACCPVTNGRWRAEPLELAAGQHSHHQSHQQGTWGLANLGHQLSPPTLTYKQQQVWQPKLWHHQSVARCNHHVNNNYDHHELLHWPAWPTLGRLASTNGGEPLVGGRRHHRAPVSALALASAAGASSNKRNFVVLKLPVTSSEQVELVQNILEETRPPTTEAELLGATRVRETRGKSRRQVGKYKRQALDLAVNRLHILEGFDDQLREFAAAGAAASSIQKQAAQQPSPSNSSGDDTDSELWRQELCVLTLEFSGKGRRSHGEAATASTATTDHNNHRHKQQQPNQRRQHNCLASERLKRHVPPYMLNLQRQLLSESRTLATAVRLMPYQSLVMRSFRQPPLAALGPNSSAAEATFASLQATNGAAAESGWARDSGQPGSLAAVRASDGGFQMLSKSTSEARGADAKVGATNNEDADDAHDGGGGNDEQAPVGEHNGAEGSEASIVVELSALGPAPSSEEAEQFEDKVALGGDDQAISVNAANNLEAEPGADIRSGHQATSKGRLSGQQQQQQLDASNGVERPDLAACNLARRAQPAHERSELCYWFQLGEQLRLKINGSLVRWRHSSAWKRERLVEAELHVFKLLPEMLDASTVGVGAGSNNVGHVATQWIGQQQQLVQQPQRAAPTQPERERAGHLQQQTTRSKHSSSWQHLKTNLLEVSLYQILPKKNSSYHVGAAEAAQDATPADFPLRLLDIRRIDLYSTGWETFYVKRAVEDWLRDASLNLGLVLKAKSMFGEPVRIGLIRFADLYDHRQQQQQRQRSQQNTHTRRTSERPTHHRHDEQQQQLQRQRFEAKQPPANEPNNQFDLDHQPILVIYTTAVH